MIETSKNEHFLDDIFDIAIILLLVISMFLIYSLSLADIES